jgi:hypothetical protein
MKTWTIKKPSKAGFYWWKFNGKIDIIEVLAIAGVLVIDDEISYMNVSHLQGRFCGPLVAPK